MSETTPTRSVSLGVALFSTEVPSVAESFCTKTLPKPRHRDGLVLMAVMVFLAAIAIVGGVILKVALAEREQARNQEVRLQAEWLVESAVERAAARLREHTEYAGEVWTVPAGKLARGCDCVANIIVDPIEGQPRLRRVRVRVDLSRDSVRVARQSKDVTVEVNPQSLETEP